MGSIGVPVVISVDDHKFELDESALENLLLKDDIKDLNVVVVSVSGAFRKGKSFILDFFLRYMKKYGDKTWLENDDKTWLENDDKTWLGNDEEPLSGFPWRGGAERDTTGILMWSEIFKIKLNSDENVAVIFLDTQGSFDSESTVKDCATIFALSTMLSSIQIYNLSQNIQEDDLQHLQLFTEYGKLALADTGQIPFQKIQFLVRDWSYPYEANYGLIGGKKILERRLKITDNQHSELQLIRKHIKSCFTDISCFLMPHPGLNVATNPNFCGKLSDIENNFKDSLLELVPSLLAPENLIKKQIGGQEVKAKDLLQYFKAYMNIYSGDELPEPKSMLVATAEANNLAAVAAAKDTYRSTMEEICGSNLPFINPDRMENEHNKLKNEMIQQFDKTRKMGGEEFSENYRRRLETDIEDLFKQYKQLNELKSSFTARTPSVLLAVAATSYVFSNFMDIFALFAFSNVFSLITLISVLLLISWLYARFTGQHSNLALFIDVLANAVWLKVIQPIVKDLSANKMAISMANDKKNI